MNLFIRLFKTILVAMFRKRVDILDESVVSYVVWPNDLDINLHMTNGRFLSIMDLGRVDLIVRTGMFGLVLKNRWAPIVGTATVRYRKSLMPFQRYQLRTKVVCWDDKWIYMEQSFERNGEVIALGYVKALFRVKQRTLRSREILTALGQQQRSPHMPPALEALRLAEGLTGEKPGRV